MTRGLSLAEAFVTIRADFSKFSAEVESGITKSIRAAERHTQGLASLGEKLSVAGQGLSLGLTAPIAALGAVAAKTSIDFESSFAGIRKTVQLTEEQFDALAQANRNLAKDIPVSVNELNRIGQLAGQLGIRGVDNLAEFEDTIAKLAVSTDLTAEQGALAFAQMANIIQLPQDQIDNLGASVVDLGNNFATVESQIVEFSRRIAGAGALANLTAGDITGISAAFASLGIRPEAGGTAIQRVLVSLVEAAAKGGEELDTFARTAGLTAEEFTRLWEQDASEAFVRFVEGLGRQGNEAITTLEELGLTDQRLTRSFLSAANAGDLLRRAVTRGNTAFEQNTALQREADKRFSTTASQIGILINRVTDVAITFGDALNPAIRGMIDIIDASLPPLQAMAEGFGSLPPAVQLSIIAAVGFTGAVGPMLIVAGTAVRTIAALRIAMIGLAGAQTAAAASATTTGGALRGMGGAALFAGRAVGVLGLALGAAFALQAGAEALGFGGLSGEMKKFSEEINKTTSATEALKVAKDQLNKSSGFEKDILEELTSKLQEKVDQELRQKEALNKQVKRDTEALKAELDAALELDGGLGSATKKLGSLAGLQEQLSKAGGTTNIADAIAEGIVTLNEATGEFTVDTVDNFAEMAAKLRKEAADVKTKAVDILADGIIDLTEATGRFTAQQAGAIEALEAIEAEQTRFKNRAFELTKTLSGVAFAFVKSEQAARRMTLALAKETADKAQAAAQALFGKPTRETAQLNQQLAQLQLREAQLPAGREDPALQKQIEQIQRQIQVRQAEIDIMQNSITLADRTLLSQGELSSKAREVAGALATATGQIREQSRLTGQDVIPEMDEMRSSLTELRGAVKVLTDDAFRNALLPTVIGPNGMVTLFDAAAAKAGLLAEAQSDNTTKLLEAAAALERWQTILDDLAAKAKGEAAEQAGLDKQSFLDRVENPADISEAVRKGVEAALTGTNLKKLSDRLPGNYAGTDFVPIDDYVTRLHKGERVLTAAENRAYSQGGGGPTSVTYNVTVELDGQVLGHYVDQRIIETTPSAPGRM